MRTGLVMLIVILILFPVLQPAADLPDIFDGGSNDGAPISGTSTTPTTSTTVDASQESDDVRSTVDHHYGETPFQVLDPSDPCVSALDYGREGAVYEIGDRDSGPYLHLKIGSFDPLEDEPPDIPSFLPPSEGSRLLVQFKGPIEPRWKETLTDAGVEIIDPLPDHAYIVSPGPCSTGELESLEGVRWVGSIYPSWKVDPRLYKDLDGVHEMSVDLTLFPSFDRDEMRSFIEDTRVGTYEFGENDIRLTIQGNRIRDIAAHPDVYWIEPTPEYHVLNDLAADIMEVDTIWSDLGLDGTGQIVAVCDTGLDTGVDNHFVNNDIHLDFDNRVNFFNWYGNSPDDLNGHGTHVSGTIMGNGARSSGQFRGMAYNASIIHQAAAPNVDSTALYPPSNLNQLYIQAYNAGARIHSNSWGNDDTGEYTSDSRETDEFMWNNPEMLILYAGGNDGSSSNTINDPSTAKNCVAVGACYSSRSGDPESIPSFSSRGYTDDGRLKPDIIAPGTAIISARSSVATDEPCSSWGSYNTYYTKCGGTSMATPATAGAATLLRQYFMDNEGLTPSAALLKATLINGAKDVTGISASVPNIHEGWGRVDLNASLKPSPGPGEPEMRFIDHPTGLTLGGSHYFQVRVSDPSEPLEVTLAWTDFPGNLLSWKNLQNDLHLRVVTPDPQVFYRGNVMSNGASIPGGSYDTTNNVERVVLQNPALGTYTIQVMASDIPMGPQPFAVVVSGIFNNTPPEVIVNTPLLGWYSTDPGLVVDVDFSNGGGTALLDYAQYKVGLGDAWHDIFTTDTATFNTNWNVNWSLLSEGENTIAVRVFDTDGFQDLTFDSLTILIDQTPPTIQLNQLIYGWYSEDPGEVVDAEVSDGLMGSKLGRVEYHKAGIGLIGTFPVVSSSGHMDLLPIPWSNLSEGENILEVKLFDNANNEDETFDLITVLVDTQGPDIEINRQEYGWYSKDPGAVVDVDFSNGGSGTNMDWASYRLEPNTQWSIISQENSSIYDSDWSVNWSVVPEGLSTISVQASDRMEHMSTLLNAITFYKDTIPPTIVVKTPSLGWYDSDPGPVIDVDFDAGSNVQISSLVGASYRINGKGESFSIFSTNSSEMGSNLQGTRDPVIMNYDRDFSVIWERLSEGPNRIDIEVSDGAGNKANTKDAVTVYKDTQLPVITVNRRIYGCWDSDPGPIIDVDFSDGPWSSGLASAQYRLSQDGAWISIPLPVGTEYTGQWSLDWDLLMDGDYSIDIQLTDKVGNSVMRSEAILISKDSMAPPAPVPTSPEKDDQLPQEPPYLFSWEMAKCGCIEATSFILRIEHADGPLKYPKEFSTGENAIMLDPHLDPGNYTWRVKAVDMNGRIGPWSEEWRFSIVDESTTGPTPEVPDDDDPGPEPPDDDENPTPDVDDDDVEPPGDDQPQDGTEDPQPSNGSENEDDGPNGSNSGTDAPPTSSDERSSDPFPWLWWVLAIAMATVVLVVLVRMRKRSSREDEEEDDLEISERDEHQDEN